MKRERTLYSQAIRRSWLQRAIRISGDVQLLVEYDARGFGVNGTALPRIRVDGEEVYCGPTGGLLRRHQYLLPATRSGLTLVLEIEFTTEGLHQLHYFRLSLDSAVVYEEERGAIVAELLPQPLPIPSRAPRPEPSALPIASDPGSDEP